MRCRVIKDYTRQYEDPIAFERGEVIQRERRDDQFPGWWWCTDKHGRSGWVHESYFEEEDYRFVAVENYNARELTVKAGDVAEGERECDGWLLATSERGERGWLPLDHVERLA
jgi:hypothetical protein